MNQSPAPRILVVDDDPLVCELLRLVLTQEGYEVIITYSGEDALQAAQQLPNMVISDVVLPGMDGFALCHRLRENKRTCNIPILMLTFKSDLVDKIARLEIGPDDCLPKPFQPEELKYRVKNLLTRS